MFPELSELEDEEVLEELKEAKKKKTKSFDNVINKKKLNSFELEEVMVGV